MGKEKLNIENSEQPEATKSRDRFLMTWRWHFYAALYVIPFMLMLCVTGLLMLYDEDIEHARYHSIIDVAPTGQVILASDQLQAVQKAFPDYTVTEFIPSKQADFANRFSIKSPEGKSLVATVNQYTGEVLGTIDRNNSIYYYANKIHAELMIGTFGDYLIEIAASLGMLLLISGVYLWWIQSRKLKVSLIKIRTGLGKRALFRDIHANIGGWLSIVLLFFLISGLSWTGIWGIKYVQAWNTFPTYYSWGAKPDSKLVHESLNEGAHKEIPWNLELSEMPESKVHDHSKMKDGGEMANHMPTDKHATKSIGIDAVIGKAKELGFTNYRIFLPQSKKGVFTVTANSMAGDVYDPRKDQTSHFDQYTGELLINVTWDDYSTYAKFMAAGVSLHQGDVSTLNKVINTIFCLSFIVLTITGVLIWLIRRKSKSSIDQTVIGAPPVASGKSLWLAGGVAILFMMFAFPLGGLTIASVLVLDALFVRRSEKLRKFFG